MDDLQRRFHRLDRVQTPDVWNEAVGRAAELELGPPRALNPRLGLVTAALLLAALVGTVSIGSWLDRPSPGPKIVAYDNGMIVAHVGCGGLVGLDPDTFQQRELVAVPDVCGLGGPSSPAWSRDGSHLAYAVSGATENADATGIWLYESATGDTRQLTSCQVEFGCLGNVDISPDASLVAYIGGGEPEHEGPVLVVHVVDSGDEHRIPLTGAAGRPVFSPDGNRIAVSQLGGRSGVYLVDVSGAEDGNVGSPSLLHGIVEAGDLTWSPDGQWIAMTQTGGLGKLGDDTRAPQTQQIQRSGKGVVIVNADNFQTRVLATLPREGHDAIPMGAWPTWSADSASVAYMTMPMDPASRRLKLELWTVSIDGGDPTRIYESGCCVDQGLGPVWSPDGAWIAFGAEISDDPNRSGTFLIRPDGSEIQRASGSVLEIDWQPVPRD
jgi:Tol biopolymer transport system component